MKLWLQLGRAGDIMNILPLLWKDAQSGIKPSLMVAAEFAPLLEGVSYVDVIRHEGPHYELDIAVAKAKTLSGDVVVTQFNGPRVAVDAATRSQTAPGQATSFQKDSWRVAGRLKEWDDCLPLVFDRRDKVREEKLLRDNGLIKRGKQKPLMLLSLNGNSSPFPYVDLLRKLVTLEFGSTWRIMELPQAERLYDLLALYEKASLLIAVDSAPLHLAWAHRKLPVFALTQDKPSLWHGSSWKPNHLWYCRYHDWPERSVEMVDTIKTFPFTADHLENFVTVWNAYESKKVYASLPQILPVFRGACGRDSGNTIHDSQRHPYLKDVLRMAIQRAPSDDSDIRLSRPQVGFPKSATLPCFAYRMEDGKFSPIADLFCATKSWWKEVFTEIPDFILSNDHVWSEGLRVLFQQRGASDETGCCTFVKDLHGRQPITQI